MIIPAMSRSGFSAKLTVGVPTALVWALAAGSMVYWVLQAGGAAPAPLAPTFDAAPEWRPDSQAVARSLGMEVGRLPVAIAAPEVSTSDGLQRLSLRGVLTHGTGGAALLALDDGPARPVRVGGRVEGLDGDWWLESVTPHAVVLSQDGAQQRLEMPPMEQRSTAGDAQAPQQQAMAENPAANNAVAAVRAQAQARAMAARQRAAMAR